MRARRSTKYTAPVDANWATSGSGAARNAQIIEVLADDLEDLHGYAMKEARKMARLPGQAYAKIKRDLRIDTIERIETRLNELTTRTSRLAG